MKQVSQNGLSLVWLLVQKDTKSSRQGFPRRVQGISIVLSCRTRQLTAITALLTLGGFLFSTILICPPFQREMAGKGFFRKGVSCWG